MQVAALTQGLNVPSARFRIRQLISPMTQFGVNINEFFSAPGSYPPRKMTHRLMWALRASQDSLYRVGKANEYDLCILQRELISTIPSFEFLISSPLIVDIDDAIWVYRRGVAAANLCRNADHIVVGNNFLAEYFSRIHDRISIIPTGVDTLRFRPLDGRPFRDYGVIGWSGTSGGYKYFEQLISPLSAILQKNKDWKIRFVSDRPPSFNQLPPSQVEFFPWCDDLEADQFADFDISLMPLIDSIFCRGKCSYKMLLSMATAVPVVVSNIGMNREILGLSEVGFGAEKQDDWFGALDTLIADSGLRSTMGRRGRRLVEQRFSLEAVAERWSVVLNKFK